MNTFTSLDGDTIAAIATAPGRGGIGIIRLSGSNALNIGKQLTSKNLSPRTAQFCTFADSNGSALDTGLPAT